MFAGIGFAKCRERLLRVAYYVHSALLRDDMFRIYLCTCVLVYFFFDKSFERGRNFKFIGNEEFLEFFGVSEFSREGAVKVVLALSEERLFGSEGCDFVAQFFLALGGLVGA